MDFKKIKNEIKLAFLENKIPILISAAIFIVSLLIGYFFEGVLHEFLSPVLDDFKKQLDEGLITLTFKDIFSNNFKILLAMYFFGAIFCLSAFILAFNGLFLGYFIGITGNLLQTSTLIVPHGIFEISACIIGTGAGFVLFIFIFKVIKSLIFTKNNENLSFKNKFKNSILENSDKLKQSLILLGIAIVLMIIAGIIEVYFTIEISKFILSLI